MEKNSAPKERILIKCDIWAFLENLEKIQVPLKSDKNSGYITLKRFHVYDNISLNFS